MSPCVLQLETAIRVVLGRGGVVARRSRVCPKLATKPGWTKVWTTGLGLAAFVIGLAGPGCNQASAAQPSVVGTAPVAVRTQSIELRAGWNAVFLEVDPFDTSPEALFAGLPVDVVAAHLTPASGAQFVSNPDADLLRKSGWNVWYSADREDHFLTSLHAIHGQLGYLVHATTNIRWNATGAVMVPGIQWRANAFNLVGFSVSATVPPTFGQFFSGSAAHRQQQIYRLVDGAWVRVADPTAATMRAGEAFWIYCDGASRYGGPLAVEAALGRGLVLGSQGGSLILRNQTRHPVSAAIEHPILGANPLPVSIVVRAVGDLGAPIRDVAASSTAIGWIQPVPPIESGEALRIPLAARREAMTRYMQATALRITTDMGTETWIPIVGVRDDLKGQ